MKTSLGIDHYRSGGLFTITSVQEDENGLSFDESARSESKSSMVSLLYDFLFISFIDIFQMLFLYRRPAYMASDFILG